MTLEKPRTEATPAEPAGTAEDEPAQKSSPLNVPGLLAGAATAATMAVLGGHLSVVGTVLGAALTSVVSGIAVAVYSTSIEKSRHGLRKVRTAVSQRVLSREGAELPETHGSTALAATGGGRWAALRPRLRPALVSTGAIIGLAVAAIFGIQALTGTELSSGTGTIQRSVTGSESVAVRTSGTTAPGSRVDPATGVAPSEGTVPTAEATAGAPTAVDPAPAEVGPTGGAAAGDGTTTGDALPDAGAQDPAAQDPAAGQTGTDGGASAQQGATGDGAAPAAP